MVGKALDTQTLNVNKLTMTYAPALLAASLLLSYYSNAL